MNDYNYSGTHIPLSTLIQYHKMGFKLIPISDDGITPNVNRLLTPEERKASIHESKCGKEEPLNYICYHPEFWDEERIEREDYRFINVATLTGKTHLKAEDDTSLYLNALDIDSEQVFTILACLEDSAMGMSIISYTKHANQHLFRVLRRNMDDIFSGYPMSSISRSEQTIVDLAGNWRLRQIIHKA